MATISNSLDIAFTPAAGDFIAQVSGGVATLMRRGSSAADWVRVGEISGGVAPIIENPVAGAQYKFVSSSGSPVVQADQ